MGVQMVASCLRSPNTEAHTHTHIVYEYIGTCDKKKLLQAEMLADERILLLVPDSGSSVVLAPQQVSSKQTAPTTKPTCKTTLDSGSCGALACK